MKLGSLTKLSAEYADDTLDKMHLVDMIDEQ